MDGHLTLRVAEPADRASLERTAELCELLRSHASQLLAGGGDSREHPVAVRPRPRLVTQ